MYKKIVVPLDGSKLAEVALPYAEELASKMGADIILLSVLESDDLNEHERHQTYINKTIAVTKYHAAKYIDTSRSKAIKVGAATRVGSPAEAIVQYADKGDFKLIVMATHGRSGLSRWAVGSIADKVVRSTVRQPLILIRAKDNHTDVREKRILKKILVPLDGSRESEVVIQYISEIATKLQGEVTLLQVLPPDNHTPEDPEAYLQSKCRELEEKGIAARYRVGLGSAAEGIIDIAGELAIDMVAMSTHGRSGVSLWALGSVAQKVLLGGNTPLLLVRQ